MKDISNSKIENILRQKAEELLDKKSINTDKHFTDIEIFKLVHELDVHQIELEILNEELNSAKLKAEVEAEKYANLYNFAPSGYFTLSKEGVITELNFKGATLIGKERLLLVNKRFALFIPDESKPIFNLFLEKIFESKTRQTCEILLSTISEIPTFINLTGIVDENDNQCLITMVDISQRKKAEEETKINEEKYRTLFETNRDSITIFRIDSEGNLGNFIEANPATTEIFGYSKKELLTMNINDVETIHEQEKNSRIKILQSEGKVAFETVIKGKNGIDRNVEIETVLINYGNEPAVMNITRDITERKHIKQQLIKAKDKAEESDRLKLAFLANMSHEIRTPMNGILGFTELLKEKDLTSDIQQEYIKIIEKSGKRMLNIINDIINISKIESGQIEITLSETNVNEQIEYLYTFFKPEATQKNILFSLTKELSPKDSFIKTDREKIYAILTNLIKNALKFTNEGSIEFGCVKKGKNLEFFVKDTGLGISNLHKKLIFERFRQANESINRSHEGSGLGLAISKAYVELLGGKIWVESEEGKGSIFYFNIPYNTEFKPKEKNVVKKADAGIKQLNTIKNLKVLIVEDDAISKLLITIAVKPYSREILKVSTGLEAIEACRNNPDIDLVMMDINMPKMSGYEATKQIRKFNKDLVIIAQTANGMQSDRDKTIAAGCTDYISKPVNITILGELIQKYFEK